jgi:four helix bundle protein
VNYQEWERGIPEEITGDSLHLSTNSFALWGAEQCETGTKSQSCFWTSTSWKVKAYRLALFAADVGWHDVTRLMRDRRTAGVSDQLYRALGSIGANLAEGYSRGTGRDRARFYEYALGSARESRDWYYKGRHVLGETIVPHRLQVLTEIVRLLLTMIPQQRGRTLREDGTLYNTELETGKLDITGHEEVLGQLLQDIPLPAL